MEDLEATDAFSAPGLDTAGMLSRLLTAEMLRGAAEEADAALLVAVVIADTGLG